MRIDRIYDLVECMHNHNHKWGLEIRHEWVVELLDLMNEQRDSKDVKEIREAYADKIRSDLIESVRVKLGGEDGEEETDSEHVCEKIFDE